MARVVVPGKQDVVRALLSAGSVTEVAALVGRRAMSEHALVAPLCENSALGPSMFARVEAAARA